jgi:RNA:NAD 2'-phosphotransferase (TPT1/KptA family)
MEEVKQPEQPMINQNDTASHLGKPEQPEQSLNFKSHFTSLSRTSRTLSFILRHGAKKESLEMRPDGYVKVEDLVEIVISSNGAVLINSSV